MYANRNGTDKNVNTEARAKKYKTDFIASNSTFIIILSIWTSAYNWFVCDILFYLFVGWCCGIRCWNKRFINCCQLCAYQWANKQKCSVLITIKYSKSDGLRNLCETKKKKNRPLVYCSAKRNECKLKTVDVRLYEGDTITKIKRHESTQRDLIAQKN